MKRLQRWIRNIFGFSRAETNGLLILLPVMLIIIFSQPIYRRLSGDPPLTFDDEQGKIDSLIAAWDFDPAAKSSTSHFFSFDPNTLSKDEFDSLGFPSYLSTRIIKYRSKGGEFNSPEELLKIYGMDSAFYELIYPYIKIKPRNSAVQLTKQEESEKKEKATSTLSFDINTADTTQLKLIRGIGTVLASRIVKYREALGGFYIESQIREVYGLDSTVVQEVLNKTFIKPGYTPRQLDINKATERDFARHPYIDYKLSKTIIAYRFQHGSFSEIDDLLKIELLDKEKLDQIRPYLKVQR